MAVSLTDYLVSTFHTRINTPIVRGGWFKCWLHGHEDLVRYEPGRVYLECRECGRETPGWTIEHGNAGSVAGETPRKLAA